MNTRSKGRLGEEVAARFLKNKGYRIVDKNFTTRFGEIDIIAYDNRTLVFIEVKSGKKAKGYHPIEAITKQKLSRIIKTVEIYVHINDLYNKDLRIDGVEVLFDSNREPEINYYKSITL